MTETTVEAIESFNCFLQELNESNKVCITAKSSVLNEIINQPFVPKQINIFLIKEMHNCKLNVKENTIKICVHLIERFNVIQKEVQSKNKDTSCDFNMLKQFKINENLHSFLLANILNPESDHGQGKLFLNSFLKILGIEFPEIGQWTVTAEKGRVDILLKRQHPHSVIVIENKSNFADDQPNQLYRYWFQEIYFPNRHLNTHYSYNHPEKYQVIFLTPAEWKQPSEHTIMKPKGWDINLPEKMPIKSKVWRFNEDITNWLNQSLSDIPENNHRLKEYIKQYIEFWK